MAGPWTSDPAAGKGATSAELAPDAQAGADTSAAAENLDAITGTGDGDASEGLGGLLQPEPAPEGTRSRKDPYPHP